jgi:hypothetical protein
MLGNGTLPHVPALFLGAFRGTLAALVPVNDQNATAKTMPPARMIPYFVALWCCTLG